MKKADEKAISDIGAQAALLTGDVPKELADLLYANGVNYQRRYRIETALNKEAKTLRSLLSRHARRILETHVEFDKLDAQMLISHDTRPETVRPWFEYSFWLHHYTKQLHHPSVSVCLSPIRAKEMIAQFYALRAAAEAYRTKLAELLQGE